MGLLVILLAAMADFVIGSFLGPKSNLELARGFVGLNATVFSNNLGPGYRFSEGSEQDFFSIFSIFFPAVAGIQAGASISGDLKVFGYFCNPLKLDSIRSKFKNVCFMFRILEKLSQRELFSLFLSLLPLMQFLLY